MSSLNCRKGSLANQREGNILLLFNYFVFPVASRDAVSLAPIYQEHYVCHTSTFSDPFPEALAMKFMMCLADTVLPAPLSPLKKTTNQ